MKKPLKVLIMSLFTISLMVWFTTLVLPPILPNFASGFISGLSMVFMAVGMMYIVWCIVKKKNPYNFNV